MSKYLILFILFISNQVSALSLDAKKNMVQLLHEGTSSLAKRIELIRSAKKSIDIEYYIFARDRVGQLIFSELIKKAKQNVKIRILLDGHKLLSEIDEYEAIELAKYNIELRFFNRTGTLRLVKGQFRNHRKTLTVDNQLSIIGGRNIAESYYNLNRKYNFLDRDILISGPVVKDIVNSFELYWNSETTMKWKAPFFEEGRIRIRYDRYNTDNENSKINNLKIFNSRNVPSSQFITTNDDIEKFAQDVLYASKKYKLPKFSQCHDARIITDSPNNKMGKRRENSAVGIFMRERFRSTQEYILIDNPYFLNFNPFKSIFDQKLLHENIRMRLYTNGLSATESLTVYTTFYPQSEEFLKMGVELHFHQGKYDPTQAILIDEFAKYSTWGSHSKTFVIDDTFIIGSFNMDPHSYKWNAEIVLVCEQAQELIHNFENDLKTKSSIYFDYQDPKTPKSYYQNATIGKRLLYWLSKFPAKLMEDIL